jgi:hypothetical protein
MSNHQRNIEAVFIHRPIATGQVRGKEADIEAAVTALVYILTGEDLLPPRRPETMWRAPRK